MPKPISLLAPTLSALLCVIAACDSAESRESAPQESEPTSPSATEDGGPSASQPDADAALPTIVKAGELDASWGVAGRVRIPQTTSVSDFGDAVLLADGGVAVVGGLPSRAVIVARIDDHGVLDASFGSSGVVLPTRASTGTAYKAGLSEFAPTLRIAVSGERLIVATSTDSSGGIDPNGVPVRVIALNQATGALDQTFGTSGETTEPIRSSHRIFNPGALTIAADGKILVGGTAALSVGFDDAAVLRFTTTGSVDAVFSKVVYPGTSIDNHDGIFSAHVAAIFSDSTGAVTAVGDRWVNDPGAGADHHEHMIVSTQGGSSQTRFFAHGIIHDAAKAADGTFYAFADVEESGVVSPRVVHFDAAGAIDSAFGDDGYRALLTNCSADRGALLGDGKMLVGGMCSDGAVGLARILADGKLDPTFGDGGIARLGMNAVARVLVRADGKIVVYGRDKDGLTVVRLTS